MRKHVANRHSLLALGRELGDVPCDGVVEIELAALPHLRDCDGGNRLDRRHPQHQRVGAHRDTVARFAECEVADRVAVARDVELRAEVQPGLDSCFDDRRCFFQHLLI